MSEFLGGRLRHELGFVRVGAACVGMRVADVEFNTRATVEILEHAVARGCQLVVFPELNVTGYSCADLFYQRTLLTRALDALQVIADATKRLGVVSVIGMPLQQNGRIYNCGVVLAQGLVVGVVPKTYLPTTNEFYEERWFTSGRNNAERTISVAGQSVPFGTDLLFDAANLPGCTIGVEICEDLWAVAPPSNQHAVNGATLLLNLSASNELVGKASYRRNLVVQQSARCLAAYVYAGAGAGESTTDIVYSGHALIAENGRLLAESKRFEFGSALTMCDLDMEQLVVERTKNSSFSSDTPAITARRCSFELPIAAESHARLLRPQLTATPFLPSSAQQREEHCTEILEIQSTALAKRLLHLMQSDTARNGRAGRHVTVGISGGLDSTLALLVAVRAFDKLKISRQGIIAVTMPGFGTSERTQRNAETLARLLDVALKTVPITASVAQHFRDIGHDASVQDGTFQNAQARERTQILMDIASMVGGINVGTGDLSEYALGYCTYNGDQTSMYHVNASVPKTLVKCLVEWCAERLFSGEISAVLTDICETPSTPELLPGNPQEAIAQKTDSIVGPQQLHDFFLFYVVRHAFGPRKILFLATHAFAGRIEEAEILKWLRLFYYLFFRNQFKRSAMPDGPKIGSVALSPRGDWRMPSDAACSTWIAELESIVNARRHTDAVVPA